LSRAKDNKPPEVSLYTAWLIRICEMGEWNDEEKMREAVKLLRREGILNWQGEWNEFD